MSNCGRSKCSAVVFSCFKWMLGLQSSGILGSGLNRLSTGTLWYYLNRLHFDLERCHSEYLSNCDLYWVTRELERKFGWYILYIDVKAVVIQVTVLSLIATLWLANACARAVKLGTMNGFLDTDVWSYEVGVRVYPFLTSSCSIILNGSTSTF